MVMHRFNIKTENKCVQNSPQISKKGSVLVHLNNWKYKCRHKLNPISNFMLSCQNKADNIYKMRWGLCEHWQFADKCFNKPINLFGDIYWKLSINSMNGEKLTFFYQLSSDILQPLGRSCGKFPTFGVIIAVFHM